MGIDSFMHKWDALEAKMNELGISEDDLVEKFILGSGSGGQNLQKTSSCVYLKHIPTGIEVKCQKERSRHMNRFLARRELCEKIEAQVFQVKTKKMQEIAKLRRQKKKRSKRAQAKVLESKSKRSNVKQLRGKVTE